MENKKKSVLILIADSNGCYPVPASKGGAVSTLVEHLVETNEEKQLVDMTVVTFYEKEAERQATKYPHIKFVWIKRPGIVRFADEAICNVVRRLFPHKKLLSFMSLCSLMYYIWKASGILKRGVFDKVVLQNNIPLAWSMKLSGYKGEYYYHLHNVPRINAKCKDVFDRCAGFLCVSQFVGGVICREDCPIGPVSADKVKVVYNCIDTDHFSRKTIDKNRLREKFGINHDDKVLVFVGRMSEEKGIDKILYALDYVKYEHLKCLIVGSLMYNNGLVDEYQQKIHQLAERHKDKVVFTGFIGQQDLPDIYNFADIAVLPSMCDEAAGLTMIEALACGTPVITTHSGGIPEYVEGGAIVLEKKDDLTRQIASNIDCLLENETLYNQISKIGEERIRKYFSINSYLEAFVSSIF